MEEKKPTVEDVRRDKELGEGSMSIYDECYSDEELEEELDRLWAARASLESSVMDFLRMINREKLLRMEEWEEGRW